jgi:hypothetical protein
MPASDDLSRDIAAFEALARGDMSTAQACQAGAALLKQIIATMKKRAVESDNETFARYAAILGQPAVEEICQSKEQAIRGLEHSNPVYRACALKACLRRLSIGREIRDQCIRLAMHDSDPTVRKLALVVLSSSHARTQDVPLLRFFAGLVQSASNAADFRLAAYHALLWVNGTLPEKAAWLEWAFPQDIDWELVRRLAQEEGITSN